VAILKLVFSLLAIAGAAVFTAKRASRLKVIAGATAASLCALVGLQARHAVDAQVFDVGYVPSLLAVAIVGGLFFLFGALVAWGTERWWPNKSLERTRGG